MPGVAARAHPRCDPGGWDAVRAEAPLPPWRLPERAEAPDGTTKYALDLAGAAVETVLIPGRGRSTVCVSSQAGCTRACGFCATATLGFARSLAAGEIVLQYLIAAAEAPPGAPARNVVFMGMGEPMDNLDAVLAAVDRLTERPRPRPVRRSNVTVSTSGVLPGMQRFLREGRGAPRPLAERDHRRAARAPDAAQPDVADRARCSTRCARTRPAARAGATSSNTCSGTGVNDTDATRRGWWRCSSGLNAHVNLIPHNAFAGNRLRAAPGRRRAALPAPRRAARRPLPRALAARPRHRRRLRPAGVELIGRPMEELRLR